MPMKCTICNHMQVLEINKSIVNGESLRNIAKRYNVSAAAVNRHKDHIFDTIAKSKETLEVTNTSTIMNELQRCFKRMNKLFDSCHEWLQDPEDPDKYDINPRSNEVTIIYTIIDPDGKSIRKKAHMSKLLAEIQKNGYCVEGWETRYSDPRELILKTAGQLSKQIELLSKIFVLSDQEKRLAVIEEFIERQAKNNE